MSSRPSPCCVGSGLALYHRRPVSAASAGSTDRGRSPGAKDGRACRAGGRRRLRVGWTGDGRIDCQRTARVAGTGRDPQRLLVIVSLSSWPEGTELTAGMDVDRLIIYVAPPFREAITRVGAMVGH